MGKSVMINFRVKQEDADRIDQAADITGVSRSDFVRQAVSEQVQEMLGGTAVGTVGKRGKALEKAQMRDEGCPKNAYCVFVRDAAHRRICQTCGYIGG